MFQQKYQMIINQASVREVMEEYGLKIVKKGKDFKTVCPFHDDSNPSLCVSREKQIYTCFSCHATGNVFTFLMNYEHMDFRETLRYLGEKVGVNVSSIHVPRKNTKYDSTAFLQILVQRHCHGSWHCQHPALHQG